MALKGNIEFYKSIDDPSGETELLTIQVPMDVSEDDPHYEHRGTKVEKQVPKKVLVIDEEFSYEDVYVVITSCGFTQYKYANDKKMWYLSIIYHVFLTEEDRELNPNMPHKVHDYTDMQEIDRTSDEFLNTDIITYAYNTLKSKAEFSKMIDV